MPSILGLLPELATTMRGTQPWVFATLAASQYDYAPRTKLTKSVTSPSKPVLHALALDFTPSSWSSPASSYATPMTSAPSSTPSRVQMPLELILAIIEIAAESDPIASTHLLKTCTLGQYTSFVRSVSKGTPKARVLKEAVRSLKVTIDYAHPSPISQRAFAHAVSVCTNLRDLDVSVYGSSMGGAGQVVGEVDEARLRRHAPSFSEDTLNALRTGPKIESLALRNWTENHSILHQLLSVYTSISSLSLSGSTPSAPPTSASWSGVLASLHLNVQTAPTPEFLSWLLSGTSTASSLRHLAFEREPCAEFFEWVMHACGRDLRSLSVPSLPAPSIPALPHSNSHSTAPSTSISPSPASTSPPGSTSAGSSSPLGEIAEGGPCGIEICERLEVLCMDRPHLNANALKSVPHTVRHVVLGLDKDTSIPPVVELVKTRRGLGRVTMRMWSGGEGHRVLPILRIACATRGVELECV
ncbi:hypothetical protein FA13DRAFT_1724530 [Coprinellus micaceus]|uniref:F-box domain-containing protein n=1 Tax=Coprinellus micaceus TaxID=71717 RepID=A0A4Y7TYF7_COPMI|nr:hypothetical protein FA13DRAFT_1724530 [Coprinellus micaceus]